MQKVFSPSKDVCGYFERGKRLNKKDPKIGSFCVRRLFCRFFIFSQKTAKISRIWMQMPYSLSEDVCDTSSEKRRQDNKRHPHGCLFIVVVLLCTNGTSKAPSPTIIFFILHKRRQKISRIWQLIYREEL